MGVCELRCARIGAWCGLLQCPKGFFHGSDRRGLLSQVINFPRQAGELRSVRLELPLNTAALRVVLSDVVLDETIEQLKLGAVTVDFDSAVITREGGR